MKRIQQIMAGLVLLAFAGIAPAQDGGNLVKALDHGVANLDATVRSLLQGDIGATSSNLNETVSTLLVDLADGTHLEGLAQSGSNLGDQLTASLEPLTPVLNQLAAPVAEIAAPLSDVYLSSGVLVNGLPLVNGETVILLMDTGIVGELAANGVPIAVLRDLLKADLIGPGDGDGGGVLVPGLLDGGGGIKAPLAGGVLGSGMMLNNGPGLTREELPIDPDAMDLGTLTALTKGARLRGL